MALYLVTRASADQIARLQEIAEQCNLVSQQAGGAIAKAFTTAAAMRELKKAITPEMMEDISALAGNGLGFKTDKDDKGGYSPEVLKDVAIEAVLRGFNFVGNEFNVLAGRFYAAKAGLERKIRTLQGLADFRDAYDCQDIKDGAAKVQAIASWTLDGKADRLERRKQSRDGQDFDDRIPVRVNSGMGMDAILGKAKRKFYGQIYDRLTGAVTATPEGEVGDVLDVEVVGSDKKVKRSKLFDDPGTAETNREEVSANVVQTYRDRLDQAAKKSEVSQLAREAGQDRRLTDSDRRMVIGWCNEQAKGLK